MLNLMGVRHAEPKVDDDGQLRHLNTNYLPGQLEITPNNSDPCQKNRRLERWLPKQPFLVPQYNHDVDFAVWEEPIDRHANIDLPTPLTLRFSPDGSRLLAVSHDEYEYEFGICYCTQTGDVVAIVRAEMADLPESALLLPHNVSRLCNFDSMTRGFEHGTIAFSDDGNSYFDGHVNRFMWRTSEDDYFHGGNIRDEDDPWIRANHVAMCGDASIVAIATENGFAIVYPTRSTLEWPEIREVSLGADVNGCRIALAESGDTAALASMDGRVWKIDLKTAKAMVIANHGHEVSTLAVSLHGDSVLWTDSEQRLFEYAKGKASQMTYATETEHDGIAMVCLSRNGRHVGWTTTDGRVQVWNRDTDQRFLLRDLWAKSSELAMPLRSTVYLGMRGAESRDSQTPPPDNRRRLLESAKRYDDTTLQVIGLDREKFTQLAAGAVNKPSPLVRPVTSLAIFDNGQGLLASYLGGGMRLVSKKFPDGDVLFDTTAADVRFSPCANAVVHRRYREWNETKQRSYRLSIADLQFATFDNLPASREVAISFAKPIDEAASTRLGSTNEERCTVHFGEIGNAVLSHDGRTLVRTGVIGVDDGTALSCVERIHRGGHTENFISSMDFVDRALSVSAKGEVVAIANGIPREMADLDSLDEKQMAGWTSIALTSGAVRQHNTDHVVTALCVSMDGKIAAVAETDGSVSFWEVDSNTKLSAFRWPHGYLTAMASLDSYPLLALGDCYGNIASYAFSGSENPD